MGRSRRIPIFSGQEGYGFNGIVAHKVLLIDDTVKSYKSNELAPIIRIITNNPNRLNLPWSERDKIKMAVGLN